MSKNWQEYIVRYNQDDHIHQSCGSSQDYQVCFHSKLKQHLWQNISPRTQGSMDLLHIQDVMSLL